MASEELAWLHALREYPDQFALHGDARSFYERALDSRPFFAAHLREPLWPFLIRPLLSGDENRDTYRIRTFTGIINVFLVAAIGCLAWRLGGPLAGGFAAALFSGSSLTSYYGISGLREPLMSLLLVTLTTLWTYRRNWLVTLGIIGVTGMVPLLRLDGLLVVTLVLPVCAIWVRDKSAASVAMTACLFAWGVTAPYLTNLRRECGSAFAPLHQHARYWRNHEFAGQPGHLTREEVLANAYGGAPVTSWQYVFGERTLAATAGRYLHGFWLALTDYVPRLLDERWWIWFWPVGVVWALWHWRQAGIVVPVGLLAQLPFAFILPLNMVTSHGLWRGVEARFAWPLSPFVAVWAGLGFAAILHPLLRSALQRWSSKRGQPQLNSPKDSAKNPSSATGPRAKACPLDEIPPL